MTLLKKVFKELGFGFFIWAMFWNFTALLPQKPLTLSYVLVVELGFVCLPYFLMISIRLLVRKFVGQEYASSINWLLWAVAVNYLVFGSNFQNRIEHIDEKVIPFTATNILIINGVLVVGPWLISLKRKRSRKQMATLEKRENPDTFKKLGIFNLAQWLLYLVFLFTTINLVFLVLKFLFLPDNQQWSPADEQRGTIYMLLTFVLFFVLLTMRIIRSRINKKTNKTFIID